MVIDETETDRGIGMSMNWQTAQNSRCKGINIFYLGLFGDVISKKSNLATKLYSKIPEHFITGNSTEAFAKPSNKEFLMNTFWSFIIFVCLLAMYGCNDKEEPGIEILDIRFIEELVIGHDSEILLISPFEVRTDTKGRIYIADRGSNSIKVFNDNGDFLNSIGRKGRGPAEIGTLSAFEVNSENEVIVFDNGNMRVSRFTSDGDLKHIHLLEPGNIVWPHQVREIGKNEFLLLRKPRDEEQLASFIHKYNHDFKRRSYSFAHADSILDMREPFVRNFLSIINSGNIWPSENGKIWFVPAIYDGRIFAFAQLEGKWEMVSVFSGKILANKPVEPNLRAEGAIGITISGYNQGVFIGRVSSESLGVFALNDGRVVHFSNQYVDDVKKVIVEVYGNNGQITGVGELPGFDFPNSGIAELVKHIWMDTQNRFYFIDISGRPKVLIGRLYGL